MLLQTSLVALTLTAAPPEERLRLGWGTGIELVRAPDGEIRVDVAPAYSGLQKGDELVAFDGKDLREVWTALSGPVGGTVAVTVRRHGQNRPLVLTRKLDENPGDNPMPRPLPTDSPDDRERKLAMRVAMDEANREINAMRDTFGPSVRVDKLELPTRSLTAHVSSAGTLLEAWGAGVTPLWVYEKLRIDAYCDGEPRRSLEVTGPDGKITLDLRGIVTQPEVSLPLWKVDALGPACKRGTSLTQPVKLRMVCESGKEMRRQPVLELTLQCDATGEPRWLTAHPHVTPELAIEGQPVLLELRLDTRIEPPPRRIELLLTGPPGEVLQSRALDSGLEGELKTFVPFSGAAGTYEVKARLFFPDGSDATTQSARLLVRTPAEKVAQDLKDDQADAEFFALHERLKGHFTCDAAMKEWLEAQPEVGNVFTQRNGDTSVHLKAGSPFLLMCHHHPTPQ